MGLRSLPRSDNLCHGRDHGFCHDKLTYEYRYLHVLLIDDECIVARQQPGDVIIGYADIIVGIIRISIGAVREARDFLIIKSIYVLDLI